MNVLVVEPDPVERERLAAALEGEGFESPAVLGTRGARLHVPGAREGRCPLATQGCVIVLDMHQDSDAAVLGTSAEELLSFYLGADHRVVTLSSRPLGLEDDRLFQLRRHPDKDVLLAAVWCSASLNPSVLPVWS